LTHDVVVLGLDVLRWRRTALPYAGGVHEQPARMLEELTFVCQQQNALLARNRPKKRERRDG
jgi:hypothetical protein